MRVLIQDLRFGIRTLWQQPAFTAVATLVLALGIGATTVIFSVIDAVVLRPMPYPDAGRLVVAWEANESRGMPIMNVAPPNLTDWRTRSRSFEALGAWVDRPYTVQSAAGVEQLRGAALTHEMFASGSGRRSAAPSGRKSTAAPGLVSFWYRMGTGGGHSE